MEPFLGQIVIFGGNFAPRNWALCDGQLLPIAQYQALYSILGTTYGGDGRTTFALPDLRGRVPLSQGQGPGTSNRILGSKGGAETTTLIAANLPAHNHTASASIHLGTAANAPTGTNNYIPLTTGANFFSNTKGTTNLNAGASTVTVNNNGNSTAFNNIQPYLAVNYLIALQGLFPSRN